MKPLIEYFTWNVFYKNLPEINVFNRITLKPRGTGDFRGYVQEKYTKDGIPYGVVQLNESQVIKHVPLTSAYVRYVYRSFNARETETQNTLRKVIVVPETTDYRACARSQLFSDDFVIEIGSSYGINTEILSRHVSRIIAYDISPECIIESRKRYPKLTFVCADCYRDTEFIVSQSGGSNVVFIDIGGDRCVGDQLEILQWVQENLGPELIVHKSRTLFALLNEYGDRAGAIRGVDPVPGTSSWISEVIAAQGNAIPTKEKPLSRAAEKRERRRQLVESGFVSTASP